MRRPICPQSRPEKPGPLTPPTTPEFTLNLDVDARMVGNVNGAAFWPAAGARATAIRLHPALRIDRNIRVPTYRGNHIDHEITAG